MDWRRAEPELDVLQPHKRAAGQGRVLAQVDRLLEQQRQAMWVVCFCLRARRWQRRVLEKERERLRLVSR